MPRTVPKPPVPLGPPSPLSLLLCLVLCLVLWPAAALASPPPQRYIAVGSGILRVSGPDCCGDQAFEGDFRVAYEIDEWGNVRFTDFSTELLPTLVPGVELFSLGDVEIGCAYGRNRAELGGWLSGDTLTVPVGALTLDAAIFKHRSAEGECTNPLFGLEIANDAPLTFLHQPSLNYFGLSSSSFTTTLGGEAHTVRLTLTGRFANRPPVARIGLVLPGFEQGGCPAVSRGGNPPRWEIEANDPAGLKVPLRSFSTDPDGPLSRTDVMGELWSAGVDGGPAEVIAVGGEAGLRGFGFGPEHQVTLLSADRAGALSTSECRFEVVDTTPPTVMASLSPDWATWGSWGTFVEVVASPVVSDLVGPVTLQLESIVSNAPYWDAEDILEAEFGTDDRNFRLRPWPAGPTTPRQYLVTYRAMDGAGNLADTFAVFTVQVP